MPLIEGRLWSCHHWLKEALNQMSSHSAGRQSVLHSLQAPGHMKVLPPVSDNVPCHHSSNVAIMHEEDIAWREKPLSLSLESRALR